MSQEEIENQKNKVTLIGKKQKKQKLIDKVRELYKKGFSKKQLQESVK